MRLVALLKTHFVCRPSLLESWQKERAERKKGLLFVFLFFICEEFFPFFFLRYKKTSPKQKKGKHHHHQQQQRYSSEREEIKVHSFDVRSMEKLKSLKSKKKENKEAMNDAAAAAYDAVSDGVSDVKDAVGKFVQFDANKTNFFIKLRKNLDVKFPGIQRAKHHHHHHHHHRFPPLCARKIAFVVVFFSLLFFNLAALSLFLLCRTTAVAPIPNLRFQVGTDLSLVSHDDNRFMDLTVEYTPNLQWSCKETWFDGEIQFDTKNKHVKYARDFDLGGAVVKVSGNYDYLNNAPFVGFQVVTQQGISTPANCNGFSLAKKLTKEMGPFQAECDVQGTLTLGETKLKKSGGMEMGPTKIELSRVEMVVSC